MEGNTLLKDYRISIVKAGYFTELKLNDEDILLNLIQKPWNIVAVFYMAHLLR